MNLHLPKEEAEHQTDTTFDMSRLPKQDEKNAAQKSKEESVAPQKTKMRGKH